ncbi:hypothetical protein EC968_005398 [Mortierella alpina]|nr:hypothetical protein EC968_005398 [Mortierella alpina]
MTRRALPVSDHEHKADRTHDDTHQSDTHTPQGVDLCVPRSEATTDDGAHQDSSSLFAGLPEMDASHFFASGPDTDTSMLFASSSTTVSTPFFGSLSVQGPSALRAESHLGELAGTPLTAVMDLDRSHVDTLACQGLQADMSNDRDQTQPEQPPVGSGNLSTVSMPATHLEAVHDVVPPSENLQAHPSPPIKSLSDQLHETPLEFSHLSEPSQDLNEAPTVQEVRPNTQLQQSQTYSSNVHCQQQPGLEVDLPLMTFISQKQHSLPFEEDLQPHAHAPTSQHHTSSGLQQPPQPDSYEALFTTSQYTSTGSLPNPFDEIQPTYPQSNLNQLHEPQQEQNPSHASAGDTLSQSAQSVQHSLVAAPSDGIETTHQPPSMQSVHLSQPSYDQPIPFDDRLSGPSSPVFDREMSGPYMAGDAARHSSGYSIMELSSELAQTPYFSQARQSPLIQEHLQAASARTSSFLEPSHWKPTPVETEVEAGSFDQVSLSEDIAGSAPSVPEISSPPVRERGLASLLDPQTLSAVEDLLNMPKSAAFERGMSRLFKGVKSSATSIFASPLTQSQTKAVESLEESAVKMDSATQQETDIPAAVLPQQSIPTDALTDGEKQFTTSGTSEGELCPKTSATPPSVEVSTSDPLMNHWGAPSATSKSPGSAYDLLALIAKSSEEPQQVISASTPLESISLADTVEPNHVAQHEPMSLSTTEPELRVPEPERRETETEFHVQEPEHRASGPYHHVPELEPHKPEPERYVPEAASSNLTESPYTHAGSNTQEIRPPSEIKTNPVEGEEAYTNRFEYAEIPTHSHSQVVPEQNSRQPLEAPAHTHKSLSSDLGKHHHYMPVSPVLPRASSPSVLDREVLLKKQAAVSALQAAGVGVRARPDKKERLLEKARELLERRQQSSASQSNSSTHRQPTSALPTSPVIRSSALSNYESRYSSESERRMHPGSARQSMESNRASTDFAGSETSGREGLATPSRVPPLLSPADMPLMHAGTSFASDALTSHNLKAENEQLKEQIQTMGAQLRMLETNVANAEQLKVQHEEMRHQIAQMHTSLAEATAAQQQSLWSHTQQLESIQDENRRLQVELEQARHRVQDHTSSLTRCERLEAELGQMRLRCEQYEASKIEIEQMDSMRQENERLRQELQDAQQQLLRDSRSYLSSSPITISSDGVMYSPEQLSKEAEGLRRQLKGQRDEMKEWQERVKRSEAERRDLFAKTEHLERSLADAEKHRNEQKSHQAMKDEAYKVIQERLVASFEEEKAQYMDEEAFKMVKLEHRYNLVKEELDALRSKSAEEDQRQKEDAQRQAQEQESAKIQALLEEQDILKSSVTKLQEHISQLESDLDAARKSETAAQELKKSEELWRASVVAVENQRITLQQELDDCKALLDDPSRSRASPADREKESQEMASLTAALELSRKREQELRKELELASQTIKESALTQRRTSVDRDQSMQHQIELNRLSELAAKQQENLIAAQEEKMHAEDLLQRAQIELMAARAEISQLEATLQSGSAANSPNMDLQHELEETRHNLLNLQRELREREELLEELRNQQKHNGKNTSEWLEQEQARTGRVSDLTLQLEHSEAVNQQLQQRLEDAERSLQGSLSTSTTVASDLEAQVNILMEQLEQERKLGSDRLDQLEKQLKRALNLLLEKQKEAEQTSLELASLKHQTTVAERELEQLRLRNNDDEQHLEKSTASAQILEQKLEEALENGRKRESALIALQKEREALKDQLSMQERLITENKTEAESFMQRFRQLEQDLESANRKRSIEDKRVAELEAELIKKQEENTQAQSQLEVIVTMFGKLLRPTKDREELSVLESTVEASLVGLQPLGVPVQTLSRVGAGFVALQRLEADSEHKVQDLQAEVSRLQQHNQELMDRLKTENDQEKTSLNQSESGDRSEMEALRLKLTRAEQGIGKLQQFLQEFQNEKKAAIFELQQRLDDSDKEVNIARSQLAKAQAMLLSRPSNPGTPTQGSFQSSSLLALRSEPSTPPQNQTQNQESEPASTKASMEYNRALLLDETFRGTELIHHEAVLALEPLRQQKAELERTLQDLRHRYELSQRENDTLLSELERENQKLRAKAERMSPNASKEHLERIRELELEQQELSRQLKTANREREFTRQDMRSLKAELAKLRAARS